jgi:hypothetical protein
MQNPWPPTDRARDFVAAKTRRGRIGYRSRRNLASSSAVENGITSAAITCSFYRYDDPSAIAIVDPDADDLFNENDRHFSAEGHALFAEFLTDTEVARAAVDYYQQLH